ncbi:peptidoglycan/LPS O-acetylase OafA/YrhL [Agromyces flavus]|uniref:Peptidoglycan/LPS O-acetylase OafA/YrhL n=1 Tax=Agromyces flavus TaxID=589382 RepID=A0A1H1UHF0_9MICO|nr:acyltransferase [Agromyces flavus]MCP2368215.1 peptidoglycan/LPS O-acetylase OafA/YrhL [Agromyces flavus]GGI47675.1 acyltransferase [Agromyces flavus]SDS71858.1 Peptidoglycan/LPS O-acetylase OafA/YrhL, contains acyltransferase and SGNH-hydrolase domains [Agromyces flavus]
MATPAIDDRAAAPAARFRDPAVRRPRLDSLTGLRWWAAFAVFLHHMSNLAPLPIEGVLRYGAYGVTFFFVLSGFVLTWSARPGTPATTFWWRRFARIYPSHIVALLLAIPVFYSFAPDPADWWVKPFDIGILLLSVVLLQGWSRDPVVLFSGNPAAWTLTCEAFFYALHPALHRACVSLRVRGALIATVGVFALALAYRIAVVLMPGSWFAALPLPVVRLSEFVIGIGIAQAMIAGWAVRIPPLACYLGGAGLILAIVLAPRIAEPGNPAAWFLATSNEWIILLCALTIAAVAWRDVVGRFSLLRSRVLVRLGEWSYAFYLVHATVIYAVLTFIGPFAPSWVNLGWYALLLVGSLAAAAALHHLVEKPFERRLRSWWDARAARRAEARTAASAPAPVAN